MTPLLHRSITPFFCSALYLFLLCTSSSATNTTFRLATELADEGDHRGAAVEYRRLGLEMDDEQGTGAAYWLSAYAYWKAGEQEVPRDLLDRVEDHSPDLELEALLLRGELARTGQDWPEAGFYYESVLRREAASDRAQEFAARRLAAVHVRDGRYAEALELLDDDQARAAVIAYETGDDKSPTVGGVLGLVPGLGYAYAGEYANAARSLILNSLFIFGMIETAEDDEWGAFAAITFFEITWYSGSIYGGIDASHRYNRNRLENCLETIEGESMFSPESDAWPTLRLRFTF